MNNIFEKLGFPSNNYNMNANDIIGSILKNKHPEKPEVSDISDEKFSVINPDAKAVVINLADDNILLYSNILVVTAKEVEEIKKSLFRTYKVVIFEDGYMKLEASFFMPNNDKLMKQFYKVKSCVVDYKLDLIDLFATLDSCTKGLRSVTLENKVTKVTETLSAYDVMEYLQNN